MIICPLILIRSLGVWFVTHLILRFAYPHPSTNYDLLFVKLVSLVKIEEQIRFIYDNLNYRHNCAHLFSLS